MRWNLGIAAVLAVIILSPASSHAGVNVRFVNSDRYTDAGSYDTSSASVEAAFRAHLDRLGKRFLAPGQNLNIDIVDIDLAGYQQPLRFAPNNVRIVNGVTLPRIVLRYALIERGRRVRSGEETLTDINYQMNPSARFSGDRYVYEKALLDDWFRRTFSTSRQGF
ncbi:DUF3016 domain-containing protein [Nitrobacter vulgaris]|uniref:DUF3016 domain-containing protein n=1 Tax=Nitrobacter vulgaris TaxID=29421 RepID=A0A1V4HXD4_NITVU|nr:DUF3016 domain-containing protein [Nitrobacter vulgaris]OPH82628.1 hypothetical protein B2M20_11205 [Nitrobacter vulgaris]